MNVHSHREVKKLRGLNLEHLIQRVKQIAFARALIVKNRLIRRLILLIIGATIIDVAPIEQDSEVFALNGHTFSDLEEGDLIDVKAPKDDDLALYLDDEGCIRHVGCVKIDKKGELSIISKFSGSSFIVAHRPNLVPQDIPLNFTIEWNRRVK